MLKAEKRNFAKIFTLELYACEFCELCVQVCPTDAIIMMKSFDLATSDRRELLLDKDRLHTIGLQFEPSWATGNGLRDMQTPPKAPPPRPPQPPSRPSQPPAGKAEGRLSDPRGRDLLGARRPPHRLGPGGGADQEPLPLGPLSRAVADRDGRRVPGARRGVSRGRAAPPLRGRRRHDRGLRHRGDGAARRRPDHADEPAHRDRRGARGRPASGGPARFCAAPTCPSSVRSSTWT